MISEFKVECQLFGRQESERTAMEWCNTAFTDSLTVFLRWVALVALPVILRIVFRQAVHIVVAVCLGEDARRSDGEVFAVAFYDGGVWKVAVGLEAVAVYYHRFGTHLELV